MAGQVARSFRGSFFHAPTYGKVELLEDVLIETNAAGVIVAVTGPEEPERAAREDGAREAGALVELAEGCYGLPGFIDLHVHAPQWPQAGVALDEPLDVWLSERTFPLEARYADLDFARAVYSDLVDHLLARGTTTTVYLATTDLASSVELARICAEKGQRGLVGKVVMDDPAGNPDFYRDASTAQALADTEAFLDEVESLGATCPQGVYPVVTPRFVPSCTDEALAGLGRIAQERHAYVQTHCNEGQWEHDYVMGRFGKSDAEVLDGLGLLTDRSVMAHCTFLTEADGELFARRGATVAHCPISNAYFANSACPVRRLRSQGVSVGLGTDVSGGFSPSLYDDIRQAVMASRMLEDGVDAQTPQAERGLGQARISLAEAFWLATTGGAEALHLPLGTFEVGKALDLQVVDTRRRYADLTGQGVFTAPNDVLARILYLSTPENIRQVWAQGRLVCDKDA